MDHDDGKALYHNQTKATQNRGVQRNALERQSLGVNNSHLHGSFDKKMHHGGTKTTVGGRAQIIDHSQF